jgi:hypothetical protein
MTSKLKLEVSTTGWMTMILRTTLHVVSIRGVVLRIISVRENILAGILLMQVVLLRSGVRRWIAILEQFLLENTWRVPEVTTCDMIPTSASVRKRIVTMYRKLEVTATDIIPPRAGSVRKRIVTIYLNMEGTAPAMLQTARCVRKRIVII